MPYASHLHCHGINSQYSYEHNRDRANFTRLDGCFDYLNIIFCSTIIPRKDKHASGSGLYKRARNCEHQAYFIHSHDYTSCQVHTRCSAGKGIHNQHLYTDFFDNCSSTPVGCQHLLENESCNFSMQLLHLTVPHFFCCFFKSFLLLLSAGGGGRSRFSRTQIVS